MTMPDPSALAHEFALQALRDIQETLWPGGDAEHEHDSDTLARIANILRDVNLAPVALVAPAPFAPVIAASVGDSPNAITANDILAAFTKFRK
jgi:hypothetical protein